MKKDHYRKLYIGFDVSSKKIEVYAGLPTKTRECLCK